MGELIALHRPRSGTRVVTVVGGTVAGLVAADALARSGRRVALHLPEKGVGGGFTALHRDGRRLELGVRLLELGYEDDPAVVPPLRDFTPGFGGHRPYTPLVRDWVLDLVGDRLVEVAPPQLVLDGRRHPDLHFTVDLTALPGVLGPQRTARVAREAGAAVATVGPRGVEVDDLMTLASASLANHGPEFHHTLIAPLADKFLADGAARTLAAWRRKVWMPLFWPRTLAEACGPAGPSFRPRRRFETVADVHGADGGPGAIVSALLARLRSSPHVDLLPLDAHHRPDGGALVALGLREAAAATGHEYAPERARSVLAWIEAAHDGPFPLVHVADAANPVARVSDSGPGVVPGTRVLAVELRHDTAKDAIAAEASAGLLAGGLLDEGTLGAATTVLTGAQPTYDAPTAATRAAHAAALAHVRETCPRDHVIGPATAPGADSFNEQVVAGLAAAEACA